MRDPDRMSEVLEAITDVWVRHPDLRFLQLISNLIPPGRDGFFIEDDELLELLKNDPIYGGRKKGIAK